MTRSIKACALRESPLDSLAFKVLSSLVCD